MEDQVDRRRSVALVAEAVLCGHDEGSRSREAPHSRRLQGAGRPLTQMNAVGGRHRGEVIAGRAANRGLSSV